MPQLSRPLQVALAAVALLAVVWFVALRGHSNSSESTATTPAVSTSAKPAASASSPSSPGSPSSVYHGSAPGVEGLTRDIQKAHAAVAQSEQNAAQLELKSDQASGESAPSATHSTGGTSSAAAGATSTTHHSTATPAAKAAPAQTKAPAHKPASAHAVNGTAGQTWVEGELAKKTTVALLFYSPHSPNDLLVRHELERVIGDERARHVKMALRLAAGEHVGEYGSFTRVASVYQTPTLLLITPSGEVKPPITGLTDAYSIEQAIDEKTQP